MSADLSGHTHLATDFLTATQIHQIISLPKVHVYVQDENGSLYSLIKDGVGLRNSVEELLAITSQWFKTPDRATYTYMSVEEKLFMQIKLYLDAIPGPDPVSAQKMLMAHLLYLGHVVRTYQLYQQNRPPNLYIYLLKLAVAPRGHNLWMINSLINFIRCPENPEWRWEDQVKFAKEEIAGIPSIIWAHLVSFGYQRTGEPDVVHNLQDSWKNKGKGKDKAGGG
jgi:hypothetical protein